MFARYLPFPRAVRGATAFKAISFDDLSSGRNRSGTGFRRCIGIDPGYNRDPAEYIVGTARVRRCAETARRYLFTFIVQLTIRIRRVYSNRTGIASTRPRRYDYCPDQLRLRYYRALSYDLPRSS